MDLVSYLETLPQTAVKQLYTSSWTCQAVLKGLPPLAKLYALRMTFLESPIPDSLIESWPRPEGVSKHKVALKKLKALQILQQGPARQRSPAWQLQADFKSHLREAITIGRISGQNNDSGLDEAVSNIPDRQALDKHSSKCWEALCLYLVGLNARPPPQAPLIGKRSSLDVDHLLEQARLMSMEDGVREITEKGFQFLLLDTYQQLWELIKQYIKFSAESGTQAGSRLSAVVGFLLQLGGQGLGKPLPMKDMDAMQTSIAADLAQLGLILPFQTAEKEIYISPTRLCLALAGGQSAQGVSDGFIIVESNYKVVAYTASPLKISLLQLFVRCDVLLPNCMIGSLTRQSVTEALKAGIGHEQIVRYLEQHAAPQVANEVPIVPAVVSDQIRLWQAETQRVQHYKAHLYDNFETDMLYYETAQHAKELGTWLWQDDERKRLVALSEGHPTLRDFIKASRERLAC